MKRRREVVPAPGDRIGREVPPPANDGEDAIDELARILFDLWQQDRRRRERPAA